MSVIIKPHDPAWIIEFQENKKILENILSNVPYSSIEHVGSTSVPGLFAKPVLDIVIIIQPQYLTRADAALDAAGYTPLGDLGTPDRYVFRQPGYRKEEQANGEPGHNGEMRRNTYVGIEGSIAVRNHIDVRNMLRDNEELRREYGEVKRKMVEGRVKNVDEYSEGKSEVVIKILQKAGWSEEDLDVVRGRN
jgi:GrpB-like predicted nucleotidyltransferase (UPF0157 family)